MPRVIHRKIKATILKPAFDLVALETVAGDSLGIFEIPEGKDRDGWMRRMGYLKVDPSDEGDVWVKVVLV